MDEYRKITIFGRRCIIFQKVYMTEHMSEINGFALVEMEKIYGKKEKNITGQYSGDY